METYQRQCSEEGCEGFPIAKGLCRAHYDKARRRGKSVCSIEDCRRSVHARGWCSVHYNRWYRGDDMHTGVVRRGPRPAAVGTPAAIDRARALFGVPYDRLPQFFCNKKLAYSDPYIYHVNRKRGRNGCVTCEDERAAPPRTQSQGDPPAAPKPHPQPFTPFTSPSVPPRRRGGIKGGVCSDGENMQKEASMKRATKLCKEEGCGSHVHARGWCAVHYEQNYYAQRRQELNRARRKKTPRERLPLDKGLQPLAGRESLLIQSAALARLVKLLEALEQAGITADVAIEVNINAAVTAGGKHEDQDG